MEIDWRGIAATHKLLGGQGENILLMTAKPLPPLAVVNGCVPPDDGDGPTNGGWYASPSGWMLDLEGCPETPVSWIEALADNLTSAGVNGKITGARPALVPSWATRLRALFWCGSLAYSPLPEWRANPQQWGCGTPTLAAATHHCLSWAAQDHRRMLTRARRVALWGDQQKCERRFKSSMTSATSARGLCHSFHEATQEARDVIGRGPNRITASLEGGTSSPLEQALQMRSVISTAPRERLSLAIVNHWSLDTLVNTPQDASHFDLAAFRDNPQLWGEWTFEPCGIQVLTDAHLAKARDLSNWTTTRLDDHHYLVEHRDLGAWYNTLIPQWENHSEELLGPARSDFGDMILTHEAAQRIGVAEAE